MCVAIVSRKEAGAQASASERRDFISHTFFAAVYFVENTIEFAEEFTPY